MKKVLDIYFDGATEPRNPGGAMGYGIIVKRGYKTIYTNSWFVEEDPSNTNNIAEYLAFTEALNYVKETGEKARIYGDSMMVVRQMKGEWGMNKGAYKPYAHKAQELLKEVEELIQKIKWIPREQNTEADNASKVKLTSNGVITKLAIP